MSQLGDRESIIFNLDDMLIVEVADVQAAFLATCERSHEKSDINLVSVLRML